MLETQDLAGPGLGRDPCSDVDREACDVIRHNLDLADVEPGTDLEPEVPDLVADRRGTANRPRRAVERGQKPSPMTLTSVPPKRVELVPDDPVVVRQQPLPSAVSQFGRQLRRPDDVGEHQGREHPAWIEHRSNARYEILDLCDDRVLIACPDEVVGAGQLDVLGTRNVLGEVPPVLDAEDQWPHSRWMTSVGTWIAGRTSRTSLS